MQVFQAAAIYFIHKDYLVGIEVLSDDQYATAALFGGIAGGIAATNASTKEVEYSFWTGKATTTAQASSLSGEYLDFNIKRGYGMSYGGDEPVLINGGTLREVVISAKSGVPIIDNSRAATYHYFFGKGVPVAIGINTTNSLINSPEFEKVHKGIVNGEMCKSGRFNVDMTDRVFHIGRTTVEYTINDRTVNYRLYKNDGFWDPDFIDEYFIGNGGFAADGPGPNLERFGGCPYRYLTTTRIFRF